MPKIHYTRFPATCWQQVVVMDFGKRHDTTDFYLLRTCRLRCGLVVDLLRESRQLVSDLLRGNGCNGFWT